MGRIEKKIKRFLWQMFLKAILGLALAPFRLLMWLFITKQDKQINANGYIVLTDSGELEHRHIAMQTLNRKLSPDEVVHHINGSKTDNQIGNLCLMNREKHEHFHAWLRWKKEKSGRYPSLNQQKKILQQDYHGTLLENVKSMKAKFQICETKESISLMALLRAKRKQLAIERGVPAYMIFNNDTLKEMIEKMPTTDYELLKVKGVGPVKMRQYGEHFLYEIKNFKKVAGD